jgi:uncharacterized low-complexity protein
MINAYIATAVAGARLLSVMAAGAAPRKHEAYAAERPRCQRADRSDCTNLGEFQMG